MDDQYEIRRLTEKEVSFAIEWAQNEGWNPGLNDACCFYQIDPNGFFIGLLNGEPIATGCAVVYDDHFAFCGLYIVKKEYRAQGYGLELTQARLDYIGNRTTGLDGVLDKVSKYERLGYKAAYKNSRYQLDQIPGVKASIEVMDLKNVPFDDLKAFDRRYFPAPRDIFLKTWIEQPYAIALGFVHNKQLKGYAVSRKCERGFKIGPLFAEDAKIAEELFKGLLERIKEGPVFVDVPEVNQEAVALFKNYGMTVPFEVIRMYRNGTPVMDLKGIFGITTFECG